MLKYRPAREGQAGEVVSNIAIGSLFIECNHFGGLPADLDNFRRGGLFYGDTLLEQSTGTLGGMLQTLDEAGVTIAPLLAASACPSGPVTAACYEELKHDLLRRLRAAFPVDGVLLALHGAAAAEHTGDMEGDLLSAVREVTGPSIPLVTTLDLHAHVTQTMVEQADVLIALETYPHTDAFTTGQRGARALLDIIHGRLRPQMVMAKAPVLVGALNAHTEPPGPFAEILQRGKAREGRDDIYSVNLFLVHPYLDLPEMGGGALVISHDSESAAEALALDLTSQYWRRRTELEPKLFSPAEAIDLGLRREGLMLLVETADCCGGGAAGDSVHTLRALLATDGDAPSLIPVVDPAAALVCHNAGAGARVTLCLGHQVDPQWGDPVEVSGIVAALGDGIFQYEGGIWNDQDGHMGPTAVFQVGEVDIIITTHASYDWGREQYESLPLDLRRYKFVVAKNPMNHRRAWGKQTVDTFILDTPGPTPASVCELPYKNQRHIWFPRDREIADFTLRILRHCRL